MNKYVFLLAAFISGCSALTGEEIARLSINQVSNDSNLVIKETSLQLIKGDEVAIWSDMDLEYEGEVALRFRMEVLKDGEEFGGIEIDPAKKNISIGEFKTSINRKTDWSFLGKNTELNIEEDGNYTFKGILVAADNPSLKINKAEIVFKK